MDDVKICKASVSNEISLKEELISRGLVLKIKSKSYIVLLICSLLLFGGYAQGVGYPKAFGDTVTTHRDTFFYNQNVVLPYLLQFPAAFQADKSLPMIVYLHSGSSGLRTLDDLEKFGMPLSFKNRGIDNFILLAPLLINANDTWVNNSTAVLELIDSISKKYNIDQTRIYLTGHSLGSNGSLYIASVSHNKFAAIVVLGAGYTNKNVIPVLRNTPVWLIHAEYDENVSSEISRQTMTVLKNRNPHIEYTIIEKSTHSELLKIYDRDMIYSWLLLHKK